MGIKVRHEAIHLSKNVPFNYERRTVTAPNPLARFAHSSRTALSVSFSRRYLPEGGTLVDFGAGTGLLLHQLKQLCPEADLIGIEPYLKLQYQESARYVSSFSDLESQSVDVVGAFEVFEHLSKPVLDEALAQTRRVLRPGGHLVLSVPIMYGASVGLKALNHRVFYGSTQYTVMDLMRSTVGIPIARPSCDWRFTHVGFDFRWLIGVIEESFVVREKRSSPFASLPWFLNSQVFLACTLR